MRSADRRAALAAFAFLVVPLVFFCAWRVPTGEVPDETNHVLRAASLLHGEVMGRRFARMNAESGAQDAGFIANGGLVLAAPAGTGTIGPPPKDSSRAERRAWMTSIPWWPHPDLLSSVNTAAYAPVTYIPAAFGLGLAILAGAKPFAAILAMRFANAAAFALIGVLALWHAERGRLVLLVALSLPMTVWLAGSVSQDGLVISVAALAAALLTRQSRPAFWCGTAALAVVVLQKPPLLPLAALPLILSAPPHGRLGWLTRLGAGALVAVPAGLWSLAVMVRVSVPLLPGEPYHPGPLWPGDPSRLFRSAIPGAQVAVLLHHPWRGLMLPVRTALREYWMLLRTFIGVLAQLSLQLPRVLYRLFGLAILSALGAALAAPDRHGPHPRMGNLMTLAAILCSMELIFLTLYLTWTPVGMDRIDGIQGRYFIPLFPMLLFALPGGLGWRRLPAWIWWMAPLAAILAMDVTIPRLIARYFYA